MAPRGYRAFGPRRPQPSHRQTRQNSSIQVMTSPALPAITRSGRRANSPRKLFWQVVMQVKILMNIFGRSKDSANERSAVTSPVQFSDRGSTRHDVQVPTLIAKNSPVSSSNATSLMINFG
jgi:hypothetical protein